MRHLVTFLLLVAYGLGVSAVAEARITIRGKQLQVDDERFLIRGIHYGPWRPGTGPAKGYSYPSAQQVADDFRLISDLRANTVLVYDPPDFVLDLAEQYKLRVLYLAFVQWWTVGAPDGIADRSNLLERVTRLRTKPAMLGWVLGNEVPVGVLEVRKNEIIERGLRDLYHEVKAIDPEHIVTHANWLPTRDLNLEFFDVIGFNVYPLWPPEVAALGFGPFISQKLQPIAGNKPLLLTEFGVSSLEAGAQGQADILTRSWQGLVEAGACGGVVFEIADEWWKNFDNPRRPQNWWDRVPAPNDEKSHDLDPEENYGIFTAARQQKPAAAAVRNFFSKEQPGLWSMVKPAYILLGSFLGLAACGWALAYGRARRTRSVAARTWMRDTQPPPPHSSPTASKTSMF